jgi:hypothetical protein
MHLDVTTILIPECYSLLSAMPAPSLSTRHARLFATPRSPALLLVLLLLLLALLALVADADTLRFLKDTALPLATDANCKAKESGMIRAYN